MGEIAKDDGVSIAEIDPDDNVEITVDTEVKLCRESASNTHKKGSTGSPSLLVKFATSFEISALDFFDILLVVATSLSLSVFGFLFILRSSAFACNKTHI